MRQKVGFVWIVLFFCVGIPSSGQRDLSAFRNKPWERVEQQRDEIENRILAGDVGSGFVLSTSRLFEWKHTPAFNDIATSVYRAYGGIPLSEEERLLSFLKQELAVNPIGVGWLEYGLLAMAAMRPEEAVKAFRQAATDEICCQVPLTHALLGQALTYTGNIGDATKAFQVAVKSASKESAVQFQMRHLYAETMLDAGQVEEWQRAVEECCNSTYPLECAWGLQQEAQYAWYRGDKQSFETFTNLALAQLNINGASPTWEWRWDKDRWDWVTRHLEYAQNALQGSPDGEMVLDYESYIIDAQRGDLEKSLHWLEKWPALYNLEEIDTWDETRQLWVQRIYAAYYILLARTGRAEEGVTGLEKMIPLARDNYHEKFTTDLYCQLGYVLTQANRLDDAKEAYEVGLSLLDVPGEIIDPSLAYHPKGRIGKKTRVMFVANYRDMMNFLNRKEEE